MILSRKHEIEQFAEGLNTLGLLQKIKKYPDICKDLMCHNPTKELTPAIFLDQINLEEPEDYTQNQSLKWFVSYVKSATHEKLQDLLQFITGHRSVPPFGLPHKICLKFLADDDEAVLPTAIACLAILHLPTVHCSEAKFVANMDIALRFESQGFACS